MAKVDKGKRQAALNLCGLCTALMCASVAVMPGKLSAQPDLSLELVDPKMLRVCADPHNMPFSTDSGEGFENKLAELLAAQLGKGLTYAWYPQAPGFVRNTLRAYKCDVLMGIPQGDDVVQVTNPYYRTAYALVILAHLQRTTWLSTGSWPMRSPIPWSWTRVWLPPRRR